MTTLITLALLGLGCSDTKNADTGTETEPEREWTLFADEVGDGALLSGWTDQGVTHMVGGDMHGGSGHRVAYDGTTICVEPEITERALWWIHGDRPGRWVTVGEGGTVLLEEDGARTRMDIPSEVTFYGVWLTADSIIAVGGDVDLGTGEVWHHDGSDWTALATDLPGVAFKIWEDWIVGVNISYRLEADGTLIDLGDPGLLRTVRGDGTTTTAVGGLASSLLMQHTAEGWVEVDSTGLGQPLNGVWTAPGEDIWLAGNFGTTARLTDEGLEQPDWPITSHHFHAVWPHSDSEVLFIGGNFMSSGDNFGTIGRYGPSIATPTVTRCD